MPGLKPTGYVVDDDSSFTKLMVQVLKKYGVNCEIFLDSQSILAAAKRKLPALFLIDLNLGQTGSGYELIETIRSKHSRTVPIYVVSGTKDLSAISHALEVGADDYLFKPLDREVLIAKLFMYIDSPELESAQFFKAKAPESNLEVDLHFDVSLFEVDEAGITILSKHLMPKGAVLKFTGNWISDILGPSAHILTTVIHSSIDEGSGGGFRVYCEFDPAQAKISDQVRNWIVQKKKS